MYSLVIVMLFGLDGVTVICWCCYCELLCFQRMSFCTQYYQKSLLLSLLLPRWFVKEFSSEPGYLYSIFKISSSLVFLLCGVVGL